MLSLSIDGGETWEEKLSLEKFSQNKPNTTLETEKIILNFPEFDNQNSCRIKFTADMLYYYILIDDVVLKQGVNFDQKVNPYLCSGAPNYNTSLSQTAEIPLMMGVDFIGNTSVESIAKVSIFKDELLVHEQSKLVSFAVSDSISTHIIVFEETFLPIMISDDYEIVYQIDQQPQESYIYNNSYSRKFIINSLNCINKLPGDFSSEIWYELENEFEVLSFGTYYNLKQSSNSENPLILTSAEVEVHSYGPVGIEPEVHIEIFNWNDENKDRVVQSNERNLHFRKIKSYQGGGIISFDLQTDDDNNPIILDEIEDWGGILVMFHLKAENKNSFFWKIKGLNPYNSDDFLDLSDLPTSISFDSLQLQNYGCFEYHDINSSPITSRAFYPSDNTFNINLKHDLFIASIENSKNNKLRLYPNPTMERLYVELPLKLNPYDVLVFDTNGKTISIPIDINEHVLILNTQTLASGQYILQLSENTNVVRESFIITR
jgi:hypothetical protein